MSALQQMRVGFLPLLDSALLVIAREKGFAAEEGLDLRLVQETSWANIRDRVAVGHFDAAHMLGPMVVAESIGAGQLNVPLVAPVALGLGGNAITLSRSLWLAMRHEGAQLDAAPGLLAQALARVIERRNGAHRPPTFAMVFPFSCHNYQLREWLVSGGIDPDVQARLVVLPPPLLVDALRTGQVDGFCVGEPWNSLAVEAGLGVIVAVASRIWTDPPEKVLGMRLDHAQRDPEGVAALVRSVVRAARWAEGEHHDEIASLLSQPHYVGAPAAALRAALAGRIRLARGHDPVMKPDFFRIDVDATAPATAHAKRYYDCMRRWGQTSEDPQREALAEASFRPDLYAQATGNDGRQERQGA